MNLVSKCELMNFYVSINDNSLTMMWTLEFSSMQNITKKFRRKGYCTIILKSIIEAATRLNKEAVSLYVVDYNNSAIEAYRKNGLFISTITYRDGEKFYLMTYKIN